MLCGLLLILIHFNTHHILFGIHLKHITNFSCKYRCSLENYEKNLRFSCEFAEFGLLKITNKTKKTFKDPLEQHVYDSMNVGTDGSFNCNFIASIKPYTCFCKSDVNKVRFTIPKSKSPIKFQNPDKIILINAKAWKKVRWFCQLNGTSYYLDKKYSDKKVSQLNTKIKAHENELILSFVSTLFSHCGVKTYNTSFTIPIPKRVFGIYHEHYTRKYCCFDNTYRRNNNVEWKCKFGSTFHVLGNKNQNLSKWWHSDIYKNLVVNHNVLSYTYDKLTYKIDCTCKYMGAVRHFTLPIKVIASINFPDLYFLGISELEINISIKSSIIFNMSIEDLFSNDNLLLSYNSYDENQYELQIYNISLGFHQIFIKTIDLNSKAIKWFIYRFVNYPKAKPSIKFPPLRLQEGVSCVTDTLAFLFIMQYNCSYIIPGIGTIMIWSDYMYNYVYYHRKRPQFVNLRYFPLSSSSVKCECTIKSTFKKKSLFYFLEIATANTTRENFFRKNDNSIITVFREFGYSCLKKPINEMFVYYRFDEMFAYKYFEIINSTIYFRTQLPLPFQILNVVCEIYHFDLVIKQPVLQSKTRFRILPYPFLVTKKPTINLNSFWIIDTFPPVVIGGFNVTFFPDVIVSSYALNNSRYEFNANLKKDTFYHIIISVDPDPDQNQSFQKHLKFLMYYVSRSNNLNLQINSTQLSIGKPIQCNTSAMSRIYIFYWKCRLGILVICSLKDHICSNSKGVDPESFKMIKNSIKFNDKYPFTMQIIYSPVYDVTIRCTCYMSKYIPGTKNNIIYAQIASEPRTFYSFFQFKNPKIDSSIIFAWYLLMILNAFLIFLVLSQHQVHKHFYNEYVRFLTETYIRISPRQNHGNLSLKEFYFDLTREDTIECCHAVNELYSFMQACRKLVKVLEKNVTDRKHEELSLFMRSDLSILYVIMGINATSEDVTESKRTGNSDDDLDNSQYPWYMQLLRKSEIDTTRELSTSRYKSISRASAKRKSGSKYSGKSRKTTTPRASRKEKVQSIIKDQNFLTLKEFAKYKKKNMQLPKRIRHLSGKYSTYTSDSTGRTVNSTSPKLIPKVKQTLAAKYSTFISDEFQLYESPFLPNEIAKFSGTFPSSGHSRSRTLLNSVNSKKSTENLKILNSMTSKKSNDTIKMQAYRRIKEAVQKYPSSESLVIPSEPYKSPHTQSLVMPSEPYKSPHTQVKPPKILKKYRSSSSNLSSPMYINLLTKDDPTIKSKLSSLSHKRI